MNFRKGRYIIDIHDPIFPTFGRVLRQKIGPIESRNGLTVAATVALILGPLEAATFATIATYASYALTAAAIAGLSYASSFLRPRPSGPGAVAPQDGQIIVRQAMPQRQRSYGTVCRGGAASFEETKDGNLYMEVLQGQGEIDSVVAHLLGDTEVQIDGAGEITIGAPFAGNGVVQIFNKLGTADQTAFPQLVAAFPASVTATHRWRGVPKTLLVYKGVPSDQISTYYGGGIPAYRAVQRSSLVFDPRDEAQIANGDPDRPRANNWEFSELAGLVMLDYMRHPDGFKRKKPGAGSRSMIPISKFYLPEWIDFINCCDEDVPLKAGGTEKRYRLCGTYDLTADPKDVLQAMQDSCDAEVYTRGDGTIGIHGGKWDVPETDIDSKYLLFPRSLKPGSRKLSAYNVLNVKYPSPNNDYQLVDMDPRRDEDNIDLRGQELNKSAQLTWCPSHSQARRIAKIMMKKENPDWQGTVVTMPYGLKAIGQRTINFTIPELGIDRSFLRTRFKPAGNLSSIEIGIASLDASAYAWDAETEEGTEPPIPVDTAQDNTIPVPDDFEVVAGSIVLQGGVNGSVLAVSWTVEISTFSYEINWQEDGALSSDWNSVHIPAGTTSWVSPVLQDATDYRVRIRAITPASRASLWAPDDSGVMVTTTADTTPPGVATGFLSSKFGSDVTLDWTNPNSPNFYKTIVYRGTTAVFGAATPIATIYGGIALAKSYIDTGLANGTYYWWVVAVNASGVAAAQVGPETQTIP